MGLSKFAPSLGAGTIAIFLGMLAGNLFLGQKVFQKGYKFSETNLLSYSIVLLGGTLSVTKLMELGFNGIFFVIIQMTITIVGAVLGNDTPSSNNNTNYGNQNAALSTNAPTSFAAKNINGLSNKQGEKIDKILSQCGLKDASSITAESSLDSRYKGKKGYILVIGNIKNVFVFLDKKQNVYKITYKNHTLYGKGKVKSTLNDYCMTAEEQDTVRISCEEKIKEILTSPSTAEFADRNEWAFSKNKHTLLVQGYVDSQNGFGAMIRSDFQFEIDRKTNKIKSLIFDGKELIS